MNYAGKTGRTLNSLEDDFCLKWRGICRSMVNLNHPWDWVFRNGKRLLPCFYPRFGAGKTASEFHNSLKNSRDRFDSWLTDVRVGWRDEQGAPAALSHSAQRVHQRLSLLSESAIEQRVLSLISSDGDEQAQRDCLAIQQDKSIEDTVREQLIAAQLGRVPFGKIVSCCIGMPLLRERRFAPVTRASHIKPWAACENGK